MKFRQNKPFFHKLAVKLIHFFEENIDSAQKHNNKLSVELFMRLDTSLR